jgi:hypothetical protein
MPAPFVHSVFAVHRPTPDLVERLVNVMVELAAPVVGCKGVDLHRAQHRGARRTCGRHSCRWPRVAQHNCWQAQPARQRTPPHSFHTRRTSRSIHSCTTHTSLRPRPSSCARSAHSFCASSRHSTLHGVRCGAAQLRRMSRAHSVCVRVPACVRACMHVCVRVCVWLSWRLSHPASTHERTSQAAGCSR